MALTLDATAMTTISTADATSGWTGPTLSTDPDKKKEGTNSLSSIVRNNGQQIYYSVTNQDYSSQHLRLWVTTDVSSAMVLTGLTGLRFYVNDGSNTAYWNIADGTSYSGGWLNICVDTASPDTGSATMTSIDEVGFEFSLTSSYKRVIDTWHDYLRYGDGYTAYGTAWDFADVAVADAAGGYGVCVPYEGIYFLTGDIQIGRATEQTTFSETGAVLSFTSAPVASTLYGFTVIGQSTSTFAFKGCVLTTAGEPFYIDMDDTGILDLTFNGNTVQGASTSHFRASATQAEVLANTFDGCGSIYPQGSKFESNIIANTSVTGTDGAVYITDATTVTNMKNLNFSGYTGKYAVHVPAALTNITLDNWIFDGSGTDIYWAGTAGTLTVNLTNGSDASTSATAGGSVTFVSNPVTTAIKVIDSNTKANLQGARVYIIADTGGPLTAGAIIISGVTDVNGEISDTRSIASNQPIKGRVRLSTTAPFYKNSSVVGTINNLSGLSLTVQMIPDQ